jgi:hypothetical protein
MRLAEDDPIKFPLSGTRRGGGPLELKIITKIKIDCACRTTNRLNFL